MNRSTRYGLVDGQRIKGLRGRLTAVKEAEKESSRQLFCDFQDHLEKFALKHAVQIRNDPEFRQKFHEMCDAIGVDPIMSNKDIWAELLGIGEFYIGLGIEVLHVCLSTRSENGGIMEMSECVSRVRKMRGKHASNISCYDVERAIARLSVLGEGAVSARKVGRQMLIISVPEDLNDDQIEVLEKAQMRGFVSIPELQTDLSWTETRANHVMGVFTRDGIAWVDTQNGGPSLYWFPSCFMQKGAEA